MHYISANSKLDADQVTLSITTLCACSLVPLSADNWNTDITNHCGELNCKVQHWSCQWCRQATNKHLNYLVSVWYMSSTHDVPAYTSCMQYWRCSAILAAKACLRATRQLQHVQPYLGMDAICTDKNVSFPPVTWLHHSPYSFDAHLIHLYSSNNPPVRRATPRKLHCSKCSKSITSQRKKWRNRSHRTDASS